MIAVGRVTVRVKLAPFTTNHVSGFNSYTEYNMSKNATFERRDPITGDLVTNAQALSVEEALAIADRAAAAFPAWSAIGPSERRAMLNRAADLLASRVEEFTALMIGETGAAAPWVYFNVRLAVDMLREAASITTRVSGEIIPSDVPGCLSMAIRVPAGVALGIAPWNAPIILGIRAIAVPLACGNTVILKASEISPGTQKLLGEVLTDAGLPEGVVNVVTNDPAKNPDIVEALIAHPAVRRVNFTGSTRVGRIIGEIAGRHLKPALLELGGKAPLVVLEDANIDEAVKAAAFGAFMHQGQICMSTERIVVDEKVADDFVEKLAAKAKTLRTGNPRKESGVVLGSLVDKKAAQRVHALIKDAIDKGALLVAGGLIDGSFISATVLDKVTPHMRIYHEETFGPAVSVVRVKDMNEAVRVANDTEYGLAAAVFGSDISRALEVAKKLEAGSTHINGPTVQDEPQIPFGGMKASGYGRFGGLAGIHEFTELRWITVETKPHQYPI
jgi:acyl-CoA reductase-like NAD-dependent aldehyde dehydrogenase